MKQFTFMAVLMYFFTTKIAPNWDTLSANPGGLLMLLLLVIGGALMIADSTGNVLLQDAGKKIDGIKSPKEAEEPEGAANGQRVAGERTASVPEQNSENKKEGGA